MLAVTVMVSKSSNCAVTMATIRDPQLGCYWWPVDVKVDEPTVDPEAAELF